MKSHVQAILFDLDGTLLNTDSVIFASFQHVLSPYFPSREWTNEEKLSWLGPSLPVTFRRYLPEEEIEQAIKKYRAHNAIHQKDYVTIFPNVKETLQSLRDGGYSIGLVTSKTVPASIIGLDLFELTHLFDCMIGFDEVQHHKPDPEGILLALQTLQVIPENALMVGDSVSDIVAAQRAGVRSIGVGWATKGASSLQNAGATYMIYSMDQLITLIQTINT